MLNSENYDKNFISYKDKKSELKKGLQSFGDFIEINSVLIVK